MGTLRYYSRSRNQIVMKLNPNQLRAFEDASHPEFENILVGHLEQFSPLHSASLGEQGIRTLIQRGTRRATAYSLTNQDCVRLYVETTILLGIDFDTDPQYPWAGAILQDPSIVDQNDRATRLYTFLIDFITVVGGPDRQYATQALHRAAGTPLEPPSIDAPDYSCQMIQRMRHLYPEKADYIGGACMCSLIDRAKTESRRHGVGTDTGVGLFIGLMFSIGHGFIHDPKYPWITETLENSAISPERRVELLYAKSMKYLTSVLTNLSKT